VIRISKKRYKQQFSKINKLIGAFLALAFSINAVALMNLMISFVGEILDMRGVKKNRHL